MTRPTIAAVLLVSGLVACARDDAPSPPANTPREVPFDAAVPMVLTPDGFGAIRIGMTLEEVVAAAGEDADPEAVGGPVPEECVEFRPSDAPSGTLVMIEQRRLTRVSAIRDSPLRTEAGFGIGDAAAAVAAFYGARAIVTPHKYAPAPASYITVWRDGADAPAPRGIVYETSEEGVVSRIHAGGPSIEYVEGCL